MYLYFREGSLLALDARYVSITEKAYAFYKREAEEAQESLAQPEPRCQTASRGPPPYGI